jgi:hypothetical protein
MVAPVILGSLIGGGLGLIGSGMQASAARSAARTAADANVAAARIAAEESRFRPVGITTRFGGSQFTYGKDGRVSGAGYTVSPELRAYQDRLMGLAGTTGLDAAAAAPGMYAPLTDASGRLFQLGQGYLAQSPEEVAQRYMTSQLDILAPQRERQLAALRNEQFQAGRSGLSVGATGMRPGGGAGLGATNPELEAYYNAIAQQDAELAGRAQEQGQRQLAFGTTLFGTGADLLGGYQRGLVGSLAPFQGYLGAAGDIEALGQQPLELGSALGGRIANPQGGASLLSGGQRAAEYMFNANQLNPTARFFQGLSTNENITSGLAEGVRGLFSGSNTPAYNQTQLRSEFVPNSFATNYFTPNPNARNQGYGYY